MWIDALRSVPSVAAVELGRGQGGDRAARRRLAPGRLDVVDREGDVVDAVAVRADVLGDLAVGRQRRGEHEPDVVLDHDVAGAVANLRLEPAERDRREAPQCPVVGGSLAGVADPELDVVDALERQEVFGLGVGVRVDPGAGLVGRATPIGSVSSRVSPAVGRRGRADRWSGHPCYALACHTGAHGRPARPSGCCQSRPGRHPPAVEAGAPWPLAETFDDSDEARWGPGEVLSPIWRRWCPTGSARSSGSWRATQSRCRSAGSRPTRCARPRRTRPLLPPRELYDRIDGDLHAIRSPLADAVAGGPRAARSPSERAAR